MTCQDREPESGSRLHVVIIGGGPAGSAAALTLLKYSDIRVSVIESTDFSQQRVGEVVSAGIAPLLEYLGIRAQDFLRKHLSSYEHITSWGSEAVQTRSSTFSLLGNGWHLDRNTFDADLIQQVEHNGASVYLRSRLTEAILTDENKWALLLDHHGQRINIQADFIIDASGKKSVLPRRLGVKHNIFDQLIGLTVFLKTAESRHFLSIESNPYGWWYSAMIPNNQVAVTLMTDADIARQYNFTQFDKWQELLKLSIHTFTGLDLNSNRTRIFARPAHSQIIECAAGNGWIAAGDSAVSFDPLSSLGIGHAISSGIEAARAIISYFKSDDSLIDNYARVISITFQEVLSIRRKFYLKELRWPDQLFWERRHHPLSP